MLLKVQRIRFQSVSFSILRNLSISCTNFTSKTTPKAKDPPPLLTREPKTISITNNLNAKIVKKLYQEIVDNKPTDSTFSPTLNENIRHLVQNDVTIESILDNIEIIGLKEDELKQKITCVQSMRPHDINDFLPLVLIPSKSLVQIKSTTDQDILPDGFTHRIYYFSDALQTKPSVVAQRFAKHQFMLKISFDCLRRKLEIFWKYNIKAENLLCDLGSFLCSEEKIVSRLELVKSANIRKIMPWVIRCPDSRLQSHIDSYMAERSALGKHENIKSLLAERLSLDSQSVNELLTTHPRLAKCKASRINSILDYLFAETDYTAEQIAGTPNIFYFPLKTIEERVNGFKMGGGLPDSIASLTQADERTKQRMNKWKS